MHAVIRTYSGPKAKELFDLLESRKSEVEDIMPSIDGFESYLLFRTGDGGATVTVCRDKRGTDESIRRAREWIAENAPNVGASPPQVMEGTVVVHSKGRIPAPAE